MAKTKQASVRFDPEKLELVKRKEKLSSAQKVVDFLMDAYYWQNKLVVAPQMSTMAQTIPYITPAPPKSPFEVYSIEIREAGTLDELGKTGQHFTKDTRLTNDERKKLNELAEIKSADL